MSAWYLLLRRDVATLAAGAMAIAKLLQADSCGLCGVSWRSIQSLISCEHNNFLSQISAPHSKFLFNLGARLYTYMSILLRHQLHGIVRVIDSEPAAI